MKYILTILIIIIELSAFGQNQEYRTEFDTLKTFNDKILVHYKTYKNKDLVEESNAYLYPVIHKVPRFRLTGNLFKTSIQMDSIVRHGSSKEFFTGGDYKVTEFNNGQEIESAYFDCKGIKMTKEEFQNKQKTIGPCGIIQGRYFIHEQNKK
jgi:hypothetical protein